MPAPPVTPGIALPLAAVPPPVIEQVVVQTMDDGTPGPAPASVGVPPTAVQTADLPAASSAASPAVGAGAGGPEAGATAGATGDVEALAQKVFPAVLRRLKAELLVDRERRGIRTDPW